MTVGDGPTALVNAYHHRCVAGKRLPRFGETKIERTGFEINQRVIDYAVDRRPQDQQRKNPCADASADAPGSSEHPVATIKTASANQGMSCSKSCQ